MDKQSPQPPLTTPVRRAIDSAPESAPNLRDADAERLRSGINHLSSIIKSLRESDPGNPLLAEMDANLIELTEGARQMHHALVSTSSEAERNKRLAEMDHLTEIYNRRGLESAINEMVERNIERQRNMEQGGGMYYMCVAIDLDDFKPINTEFGHLGGDLALQIFAKVLKQVLRSDDFVAKREYHEIDGINSPEGPTGARTGGDEFMAVLTMVLPHAMNEEESKQYFNGLSEMVANKIKIAVSRFKFKKVDDKVVHEERDGAPSTGELVLGASINSEVCKHEPDATSYDVKNTIIQALNDADAKLEQMKKDKKDYARSNIMVAGDDPEQPWN